MGENVCRKELRGWYVQNSKNWFGARIVCLAQARPQVPSSALQTQTNKKTDFVMVGEQGED